MVTVAHRVAVTFSGGRYPYSPTCSCGWAAWGYLTEPAAQHVAHDHLESEHESHASNIESERRAL